MKMLYDSKEICEELGICLKTFYSKIAPRPDFPGFKLPGGRTWRVRKDDFCRWLEGLSKETESEIRLREVKYK